MNKPVSKSALFLLTAALSTASFCSAALALSQSQNTDAQGVPVQSSDQIKADQQSLKQESKQDKRQAKADKKAAREKAKAAKAAREAEKHQDKASRELSKANTPQ